MLLMLKEIIPEKCCKKDSCCFKFWKKKEPILKPKQNWRYILVNTDQIIAVEPEDGYSYISVRPHKPNQHGCFTYFKVLETIEDIHEMSQRK